MDQEKVSGPTGAEVGVNQLNLSGKTRNRDRKDENHND